MTHTGFMTERSGKHEDTTVSLHPLTFEEAIAKLVRVPERTDSPAAASDSTTSADPADEPSATQTAPRP